MRAGRAGEVARGAGSCEDSIMESAQDYYRGHGSMTAPGAYAAALRELPRDLASLCGVVQSVLIHRDVAPWLYDLKLSAEQQDLANVRPVAEMLARIFALDARPLNWVRDPARRLPCVCRHFATMLTAILREQGVPARARCGFGAYFKPGRFEDHWVAEYWSGALERWILVDAQIDTVQREAFKLDFDPVDVPRDRFIIAGDGWRMCRAGRADPDRFGLSFLNEQGMWWIAQNLIRDLASLNRIEMQPWDVWGIMPEPADTITADEFTLLDRVAELTMGGDAALAEVREIYRDERLRIPGTVFNANRQKDESVAV
jgi:Transglutaminase-like superfamily